MSIERHPPASVAGGCPFYLRIPDAGGSGVFLLFEFQIPALPSRLQTRAKQTHKRCRFGAHQPGILRGMPPDRFPCQGSFHAPGLCRDCRRRSLHRYRRSFPDAGLWPPACRQPAPGCGNLRKQALPGVSPSAPVWMPSALPVRHCFAPTPVSAAEAVTESPISIRTAVQAPPNFLIKCLHW